MAKVSGVGKERIISGNKYFPIYFRFNGQRYNTSVKSESKLDAYHQLQAWQAEVMTRPRSTASGEVDYEIIREALRKDVSADTDVKKTVNRYVLIFDRLFVDFRQKHYPGLSGCSGLPIGFFRTYKSHFTGTWRAELIFIKAIMKRLVELGYSTEADLKQVRSLPTPEGNPKPMPKASDNQIQDLLEYARKSRPDFYKPIRFMSMVGRRAGETCAIMKEDVSMNGINPLIIQTKPKTAKIKKVMPPPIYLDDSELNSLIRSALANNQTPWLFPHRNGGRIPPNYLWKYLRKTSREVIGVSITPHYFRKLFLTKANRGGLNRDSMAMANIKSMNVMMKHYVETTPEGQAKVLEKNRGQAYNGNG